MAGTISFDRAKLRQLRAACDVAEAVGQDTFVFEGHELLVSYAKYLIEYLTSELEAGRLL